MTGSHEVRGSSPLISTNKNGSRKAGPFLLVEIRGLEPERAREARVASRGLSACFSREAGKIAKRFCVEPPQYQPRKTFAPKPWR